jgi:hypothetical protein
MMLRPITFCSAPGCPGHPHAIVIRVPDDQQTVDAARYETQADVSASADPFDQVAGWTWRQG